MNKYFLSILVILTLFCISCGESPSKPTPKKPRNTEKPKLATGDSDQPSNVVDPDAFSKAFSQTVTTEDVNQNGGFAEDKSKFFKEGDLVQNKFDNEEFSSNSIPSSSLAFQVRSNKKYSWLPNWAYIGRGGVRLPDAALSTDKSLLTIIDNVSSKKDMSSSLIVSINTYNFKIQNIYYYKAKLFTGLKYVPGTSKIIVWEENQNESGKGSLHLIDLKNGRISGSSELIKSSKADFSIRDDGKELVVKPESRNKRIFVFQVDDLSKLPITIKCDQVVGKTAVSPDNSLFALAGKEKIELFKFSDKQKLKNIDVKLKEVPEAFLFINANNVFAALSYMNPFYLIVDGNPKKMCDLSGRTMFYLKDNKSIVFEESKNKAISILDIQSLEKIDTFSPEKLKPRTLGSALLIGYLPHIEKYMVLDRKGNLSLFYRPGRRWRKRLIFSTEK